MARIRTLKPEFWNSPSTAQADLAVRLTFMAMWNWADDSGHGTANLKELEAFCWPNDEVRDLPRERSGDRAGNSAPQWRNFAEILGEVAELYGVVFYRVAGRPYYEIGNFKKHQSKDYRKESRYPLPDEGEIFDVTSGNATSRAPNPDPDAGGSGGRRGNSAAPAGNAAIGIGEPGTGNREQSPAHAGAGDPPAWVAQAPRPDAPEEEPDHAPALVHDDGTPTPAGIVREWEKASGSPLTDSTRAAMRLAVNQCLRAGHDSQTIAQGLADWANSKMTHPNQIPSFVDRAAVRPRLTAVPTHRHNADEWIELGRQMAAAQENP